MPTDYEHRILVLIPNARKAAVATWWGNNLDPGQGAATWSVGLSPTGNPPATHWWCSTALTDDQLRVLLVQLCQMASLTPPAGWQQATRQQKLTWLANNLGPILSATGIRVVRDDEDGAWSDAEAALAAHGLLRVGSAA